MTLKNFINIDNNLEIPKYLQISNSVCRAIKENKLDKNDRLPTVGKISEEFNISRDTVLQAYAELKKKGIIQSIHRKGYYVKSKNLRTKRNIFLLFDELNGFKEDVYYSFKERIGRTASIDIFFHNYNLKVFKLLIEQNAGQYTDYVIMPGSMKGTSPIIKTLPQKSTYLLDQFPENLKKYKGVFQYFDKIICKGLEQAQNHLEKYNKLNLIYPHRIDFPEGIRKGFKCFAKHSAIPCHLLENLDASTIERENVYFVVDDRDLVKVIEVARTKKLKIGKDIGIISYNDLYLKQVVDVGITTISTDFKAMGKRMAEMIINKENKKVENPGSLIIRNSL